MENCGLTVIGGDMCVCTKMIFRRPPVFKKAKRLLVKRYFASLLLCLMISGTVPAAIKDLSVGTLISYLAGNAPADFFLIDVRDPLELASTAIIGNENCRPYNLSLNLGAFDSTIAQLPKNALIICYCRSSGRSDQATQKLDDKGYSSAYSLFVGFPAWTGSTLAASMVKPRTDLPAPSMAISSAAISMRVPDIQSSAFRMTKGRLMVENLLAPHHYVSLFDLRGRCVATANDPFLKNTIFAIPSGIAKGEYLACLEIFGQKRTAFFMSSF
jgi:rhodanese-related sulfurtransferase